MDCLSIWVTEIIIVTALIVAICKSWCKIRELEKEKNAWKTTAYRRSYDGN